MMPPHMLMFLLWRAFGRHGDHSRIFHVSNEKYSSPEAPSAQFRLFITLKPLASI
jgi:hypothetical protein